MRFCSFLIGSLIVLFPGTLCAQDPSELFSKGNQLYQQGKYAEAREVYLPLLKNGYESGELYYNLGNTDYKMGLIAEAILSYERGMRLLPNDEDLQHNLQLANLLTADRIEPAPILFIWDYWDGLKGMFSGPGILWVTNGMLYLFAAMGLLVVLARSYALRKTAVIAAAIAGILFLFSLVVCIARVSDLSRDDQAIVMGEIVTIKNSPDAASSDAFVLHSGVKVRITDRVSSWVKIKLADGKVGWMEEKILEII